MARRLHAPITQTGMPCRIDHVAGSPKCAHVPKVWVSGWDHTLMVCVNDTATRPSDTLVSRLPSVCTAANGLTLWICSARSYRRKVQRSQADTTYIWVLAASFDRGTETLLGIAVLPQRGWWTTLSTQLCSQRLLGSAPLMQCCGWRSCALHRHIRV